MTHKSTNLTSALDPKVEALWDAICDEAEKVMDPLSWFMFTATPWVETDGKSLNDLAEAGDTDGMQKILDALRADVAAYEADPTAEGHLHPDATVDAPAGASDTDLLSVSATGDDGSDDDSIEDLIEALTDDESAGV